MMKLLQGFRDFIVRGNVIDLAVGIVIGAAFTGLVTNFTDAFINPLLKVFSGGNDKLNTGGVFRIHGVPFPWSNFINAAIGFVITAAVLYFLVVTPMNMINERRRRGIEPAPKIPSDETKLLMEIRDLLAANDVPQPAAATHTAADAAAPKPAPQQTAPQQTAPQQTAPQQTVPQRRDTGGGEGTTRR